MTGYSRAVARWLEASYKSWLPQDAGPDRLLKEVARGLSEHRMNRYEYEERNLRQHFPTRFCPECGDVVQMGVTLDTYRQLRWRDCPNCGKLGPDRHVDIEVREILIDSRVRRRTGGVGSYV